MATVEFDKFIRTVMEQNPRWFEEVEPPVSEEDVAKVEAILGAPLPEEFKHFAMTFGGGIFWADKSVDAERAKPLVSSLSTIGRGRGKANDRDLR